jgi:hypothetical protein
MSELESNESISISSSFTIVIKVIFLKTKSIIYITKNSLMVFMLVTNFQIRTVMARYN